MELGNINLSRHDKAGAIAHYKAAIIAEHDSEQIREAFRAQIKKLETLPVGAVAPLRLDRE